ncbi:alpha/beta fold hydrolase [Amycolatopsis rhabdoformis]|uniref:Alpha/beta fold hydrolase n=1 Tax=Amycolatopsis rhabdoformis TaxID=1448059 RepID=A0ABZ1IJQ5_9PSEU|nr:alpha/beta fold hydrolase [Amycolatopsis rhabdoformis]WSE34710.1 alpha/beta fold hydrolase [Amycolatopsis rhabdoformis]
MTRSPFVVTVDGGRVTGTATGPGLPDLPLIVTLHGGSYNARYFDLPGHSLLDLAEAFGFPVFSLNRPGYAGSDLPSSGEGTYAAGAGVLDETIAQLWADHAAGRPGVVIISHSIGSAIAVHVAAGRPQWPLLGIALHGINDVCPDHVADAWNGLPPGQPVIFTPEQRRMFMYGPEGTREHDIVERAEPATEPIPLAELREVVGGWPTSAAELAARVEVPVHYVLTEHDGLWIADQGRVDTFAGYFTHAPWVDAQFVRGAGHNLDHHLLSRTLHLQQLAFAWACAVHARA